MDTFEDNLPAEEVIPEQEPVPVTEPEPEIQPQPIPVWEPTPVQPTIPTAVPQPQRKAMKKKRSKKAFFGVFSVVVSVLLIGSIVCNLVMGGCLVWFGNELSKLRQNTEENLAVMDGKLQDIKGSGGNSVSGTPNSSYEGMTPAQVYDRNADSVVAINCTANSSYGQMTSAGSGFIWSADGYVISNYHVIDGAQSITVVTNDGTKYDAKLVGGDSFNDISLLKIEATDLQPVMIGKSSDLIVGDQVAAIGNALGELASTLTVGYVSAMDRIVTTEGSQINMLQTDAAINSGNSGGPLFNMKGEVIGITTAKYSGTTNSGATIEGIGFAIPMDDVIGMLEDLRDHGYITGGYLGVTVSNMDESDSELYGLPMGVLVHEVTYGSCAYKGGVKVQDIIVELGGYTIENLNDLTRALRAFDGGDTVTVVVYRASAGGEVVLQLTLDSKDNAESEDTSTQPSSGTADDWFDHFFGD